MNIDSLSPILLGVCANYAQKWNMSVRTLRVLTLVSAFIFHPTIIIYIILNFLEPED